MATSTIELKSGSGSQILFAGRIHANRTEMIIEREFLNKCWICPGQHPSVAAIVSVQREDYSLNVEIVQRAHKFPTKNCSSSFRDCAESKFHPKNIPLLYYSFIIMDCLQEPHKIIGAFLNPCAPCVAEMGKHAKKSPFTPRIVAFIVPNVLRIDMNTVWRWQMWEKPPRCQSCWTSLIPHS